MLESAYQQYLRHATLHAANDCISNAIAALPIFPHYSFDLDALYGAVDGQKFGVERPTVKARHPRKYFGAARAWSPTRCCATTPLNGYLIGAHDYEAHHVFDIWYRNTSDIVPTAITGDMHSVNKANFAILHWFGLRFEPRFTDLGDQLKELYCADDPALYEKCLIRPAGRIDRHLIVSEKPNSTRSSPRLGLKEMTQGTLIRSCAPIPRRTRRGRGVRVRQAHPQHLYTALPARSATGAQRHRLAEPHRVLSPATLDHRPGRRQEGIDRAHRHRNRDQQPVRQADRQRGHLYNSAILSRLLMKYEVSGNAKAHALLTQISPAAWRHILLNGHYTFQSDGKMIDLDELWRAGTGMTEISAVPA